MFASSLRLKSVRLTISLVALAATAGQLSADPWPSTEALSSEAVQPPARIARHDKPYQVATAGWVFLDGQFLEPPYALEASPTGIVINGQTLDNPLSLLHVLGSQHASDGTRPVQPRQFVRLLRETLDSRGMLIAFPGEPTCVIPWMCEPHELLMRTFSGEDDVDYRRLFVTLQEPVNEQVWTDWLRSNPAPPTVREQFAETLRANDEMEASNLQSLQANQSLESVAYPLTTFGMMICVFSIGHLLLYRPDPLAKPYDTNDAPHVLKMVRTSLILIVAFSTLDLIWTLLAHQAGQMTELNPLGNGLIDDPLSLAIFKGLATLVAVGVLFAVRKYHRGQLAAWWVCLATTLVAVRWVAFNSMFVS